MELMFAPTGALPAVVITFGICTSVTGVPWGRVCWTVLWSDVVGWLG